MAGIFGAGIVTAFEEADMYDRVEAVYASSAGAIIASYFLSGQTKLGSSIFYEELTHDFIKPSYILLGIYDRFWNKFINKVPLEKIRNPIDIDYLFDIVSYRKKLNIQAIRERGIPFYIHVLNTQTLKTEFINALEDQDMLGTLKSAVSAVPYYFPNDLKYVDGEIIDPFPVEEIIKRYPSSQIVVLLNIMPHRFTRRFLKGLLEGWVATLMYSRKILSIYLKRDLYAVSKIKREVGKSNIRIIYPGKKLKLWPNTTNKEKLLKVYEAGRLAGLTFLSKKN